LGGIALATPLITLLLFTAVNQSSHWCIAETAYRRGLSQLEAKRPHEAVASFREAAENYPQTLDEHGWLAAGNAYLLAGDIDLAIRCYRLSYLFDTPNPRLHTALAFARAQVQYPAPDLRPAEPWWPFWLSLSRFAWIAFVFYSAAWIALTRWWFVRHRAWLAVSLVAFVFAAIPAVGTLLQWRERAQDEATPVVVLARDATLRRGNGVEYPPRIDAPLPRGAEVRRLFERAGWWQVELANGVVGWLPKSAVVSDQ
jgi:tetratricopeptide (TPR) repeat protein